MQYQVHALHMPVMVSATIVLLVYYRWIAICGYFLRVYLARSLDEEATRDRVVPAIEDLREETLVQMAEQTSFVDTDSRGDEEASNVRKEATKQV